MARTLRVGGRIMIYVWAMEQKRRKFEKQDIFVPWNPNPHLASSFNREDAKPRRRVTAQSVSEVIDNTENHRKVRSTSSVADEEDMTQMVPQQGTQRLWFFSRSLDSVFDFGSLAISWPSSRDLRQLSSATGESEGNKANQRVRGRGLIKQVSSFFSPPSVIGSEEDVFDSDQEHLKQSEDQSPREPIGTEQQEGRQSPEGSEEQVEASCLRYYHVFREGELAELIEHHVEALHVIHSYFDHANWCVVAEKVQVWKI
ncbi:hypothetical protein XENOCAPTIV_024307 [Xenoophorus captivus]|uniref:tRNA methyltransferase 9B n=1 Tax=Xenoophorus captivus TaxID=1517983 RepID=A0ABV0QEA1_9TELE